MTTLRASGTLATLSGALALSSSVFAQTQPPPPVAPVEPAPAPTQPAPVPPPAPVQSAQPAPAPATAQPAQPAQPPPPVQPVQPAQAGQPAQPVQPQPVQPQPAPPPPGYGPGYYEPPPPPPARDQPGDRRDSWYIGFELGSGAASYKSGDETVNYNEVFEDTDSLRLAISLEAGGTLLPQLLLGGRIVGIRESVDEDGVRIALGQSHYLINATYFPLPDGEGLLLRGGLGLGVLNFSFEDDALDISESESYRGFAGSAGVGYAFWLGDAFNLSVALDAHYASLDGRANLAQPTSGTFYTLLLGFYWY